MFIGEFKIYELDQDITGKNILEGVSLCMNRKYGE
jgi:hypothetical protein